MIFYFFSKIKNKNEVRIWSIHPQYLDAKGLVALWRETLLAKNVLEEKTKGYRNHPQLDRFKKHENGLEAIHFYLSEIYQEAQRRDYHFSAEKFLKPKNNIPRIAVQAGQIAFERKHLLNKLKLRDLALYQQWMKEEKWELHPLFEVVQGGIEDWERP